MKLIAAATVAAALAFLTGVVAAPLERRATAAGAIKDIQGLIALATAAQTDAQGITFRNAAIEGPRLLASIALIVADTDEAADNLKAPPTGRFSAEDSEPVVNAIDQYSDVLKGLLAALIKKQPILSQFFLSAPTAAAIRQDEATTDEYGFALLSVLDESYTEQVTSLFEDLDSTLRDAEVAYN